LSGRIEGVYTCATTAGGRDGNGFDYRNRRTVVNARALMILGTASHVGKSVITAGLGRILADEGLRVAPFKAQNMSLNSAATPDGREIGRAQALQAEACRVAASAEMNPILIKPHSDTSSQVVLLGKVWGQVSAADYHTHRVEQLFPTVLESYQKLASQYDVVLLEGAGSPAEINLRDHDIVNLRMAKAANASCLLVGDIDRGGIFASLLGTMELLEPGERELFKGFLINKFRGDRSLLQPGVEMIERRLGLPCVGVVPYLHDLGLEEEDGVALEDRLTVERAWDAITADGSPQRSLRIGVIALPHMSNFTDFDALAAEPSVALAFVDRAEDTAKADVLILPGTKQTLDDLDWLAKKGMVARIRNNHAQERLIIGLCGGLQMLGQNLSDPAGVENNGVPVEREGLGLLAVRTVFGREKITRPVSAEICDQDSGAGLWKTTRFQGYEIHMGETQRSSDAQPFARLRTSDGTELLDGAINRSGLVFGTHVHGIFDDDSFRHSFLDWARARFKLAPAERKVFATGERDARMNRWADHLRNSLRLDLIRTWISTETAVREMVKK
jgi:adenosylcobyric acid synthase